jgi:hypothetical protein
MKAIAEKLSPASFHVFEIHHYKKIKFSPNDGE